MIGGGWQLVSDVEWLFSGELRSDSGGWRSVDGWRWVVGGVELVSGEWQLVSGVGRSFGGGWWTVSGE